VRSYSNILLLISTATICTPQGSQAAPPVTSGVYEQAFIAGDNAGSISGYISETAGQDVTETCRILFTGKIGPDGAVSLKTSDTVGQTGTGILKFSPGAVRIAVPDYRKFSGCLMAGLPELASGEDFSLTRSIAWQKIRRVSGQKSYLYPFPGDGPLPHRYLVHGDLVGVMAVSDGWLNIEYISPSDIGKSVKGWIRSAETSGIGLPDSH
jgi:hypothetical protein